MRPKSILLLVLALGCGLVASIGITQVMAKRDGGAPASGKTQPILVALDSIPVKHALTAQVLKLEEWPEDKIPEGAVSNIEDVEGRRTRAPIYPGEPILESKLFEKGSTDGGIGLIIPKGYRVITVKVDPESGLGGMILPGDRVDVAVSLRADHGRGIPEPTTKTFLQDIKVMAVNDQFEIDPSTNEKSISAKTVSLQVTPKQAQDVMVASESGKIRLVMRSPDENEQSDVEESKLSDLLNRTSEPSNRKKESVVEKPESPQKSTLAQRFEEFLKNARLGSAPAEPTEVAAAPKTWPVRLILGSEVKEVVLEQEAGPAGGASSFPVWKSDGGAAFDPGAAMGFENALGIKTPPPQDNTGPAHEPPPQDVPGGSPGDDS